MSKELQLVVVTPETTLLNEPVVGVRFPLFDGQIGVLPGRMPVVGRLGCGELVLTTDAGERSYFVDGGFVQIRGDVVTLLTSRCLASSAVSAATAESELQEASGRKTSSDAEIDAKLRDQDRARRMLAVAGK